jgi:hypothetical protein
MGNEADLAMEEEQAMSERLRGTNMATTLLTLVGNLADSLTTVSCLMASPQ